MIRPALFARSAVLALGAALALAPASGQAAMIVYDPTSYAKLIEQARTALNQLETLKTQVAQGEALLGSLNDASGVGALASALDTPAIRDVLPQADQLRGDLNDLSDLAARATALREQGRLYTPGVDDLRGRDLEAAGDRAARDLAVGEAVVDAGAQRLQALKGLQTRIDQAPTARAVLDLQARLAAEQAVIANEQMRLQGLAIAQDAEARLAEQRERERVASRRARAMEQFRKGFE